MNSETTRQLQFLASMPAGNTTMRRKDVEDMLIETGGNMLARGSLYDFVVKEIGAGVCRISLTLTHP